MIIKQPGAKPGTVLITFQFPAIVRAESVHLAGDFNRWNLHSLPLVRTGDDPNWQISLELERGKAYQFRYLVNGTTWCNDCNADRYVPNSFGSDNSVVKT